MKNIIFIKKLVFWRNRGKKNNTPADLCESTAKLKKYRNKYLCF